MNFLVIILALFVCSAVANTIPRITIKQGILVGKYQLSTNGRTFSAFTGIPYAKPPVGDLRFMPPVPADPWKGVLNASQPHAICPQVNVFFHDFNFRGDEDCLYLNVYTPQITSKKLPVLFCIHGGGWMNGNANSDFYGPEHLLDKDIIVVTINYRLGSLGFLSTGDSVVPGNNGLKDQSLALKWTRNNIEFFGGNPEHITIFGQSAGAASSHFHMISPLSRDLIKGVISNSGSVFANWALSPNTENEDNSRKLAQMLNCTTESKIRMVNCMKQIDAKTIVEHELKFQEWIYTPLIPFKPVIEVDIEGAFIAEDPETIIKSGKAANVPFLTGMTTEDGSIITASTYREPDLVKEFESQLNKLTPIIYLYEEPASTEHQVAKTIYNSYFKNGTKSGLTDSVTLSWFTIPIDIAVRLHKQYNTAPVYYYAFGYRGENSFSEGYGGTKEDYGVSHGDDLLYLFNLGYGKQQDKHDEKITHLMVNLWTNFAKTGNPTTPEIDLDTPIKWEPVTTEHLEYLYIKNLTDLKMEQDLNLKDRTFWENLRTQRYRTVNKKL